MQMVDARAMFSGDLYDDDENRKRSMRDITQLTYASVTEQQGR